MSRLSDKVAIVTGGASGIGRAAAERFLAEGASVLVVDRDEAQLEWTESSAGAKAFAGSIAEESVNDSMVRAALDEWGKLDIAFLNAGITGFGPLIDSPSALFETNVAVNLVGTVHGLRAAARAMRDGSGGSIVVTSSMSGVLGDVGNFSYNGTKAALLNVVRSAAGELAPAGIRVNAVCPGTTRTGMVADVLALDPEADATLVKEVPMKRWADPSEIANAVLFLVSDEASYVTGVALPVDGGCLALARTFPLPY
jgi:meso-butanediol dehydrogenase / (S,S)-butanediol dehydrogenase / diacetyl reductase